VRARSTPLETASIENGYMSVNHSPLCFLIAPKSEPTIHTLEAALSAAGITTELAVDTPLTAVDALIEDPRCDLVVLTHAFEHLQTCLPRLREQKPHTPIIVVAPTRSASAPTCSQTAATMSMGATDVIYADQIEQFVLVVKRELAHVCHHYRFTQMRHALKHSEERFRTLRDDHKTAVAYLQDGIHIHANRTYLNLFGYERVEDLSGEPLIDLLSSSSGTELRSKFKALRKGEKSAALTFQSKTTTDAPLVGRMLINQAQLDGEACLQISVVPKKGTTPSAAMVTRQPGAVVEETTDKSSLTEFIAAAERLFKNTDRQGYILAIGLDDHQNLCGTHGLIDAEALCRKIWQHLDPITDQTPTLLISSHQGVIATTAESYHNICSVAEDMRKAISEQSYKAQNQAIRSSATISGAALSDHGSTTRTLDAAFADLMDMRAAQNANLVHIPVSTKGKDPQSKDNVRIILRQITDAIDHQKFILLFQPIISLRGDTEEHYEVFLRMTDDTAQPIEPERFLQAAIDNEVAGQIDRWVIMQSIKMLSAHRAKGMTTRLTINLTSNSVTDPEFIQWHQLVLKAARLPSDAVIYQITEKDATKNLRQTRVFIEELRKLHSRASLSRFGLIEDPFATLRQLPVDMVKLDGSLVTQLQTERGATAQITARIKKLQAAGKLTIVPMVENAKILSTLWQAGANYIQGHYVQEPSARMDYDFSSD